MDWKPLVPVLLGGGVAILSSVVTQWWTSKRETERRAAEERERALRELKAAYAAWFTASMRFVNKVGIAWMSPNAASTEFIESLGLEPEILGATVRLLERNKEARARLSDLVGAFPVLVAKAAIQDEKTVMGIGKELAAVMKQIAEFELWLVEVRFANGKV